MPIDMGIGRMSTLEILQDARGRLEKGEYFQFGDWTACTCGHIYRAAMHRYGNQFEIAERPTGHYQDVLEEVAKALGWSPSEKSAAMHISDYTVEVAKESYRTLADFRRPTVDHQDAIAVIDQAIEQITAADREAMKQVADWEPDFSVLAEEPRVPELV